LVSKEDAVVIRILGVMAFLLSLTGCASGKLAMNRPVDYSVKIVDSVDTALIDGVPEGVTIENVNKVLKKKLDRMVVDNGLTGGNRTVTAKYDVSYFAHKYSYPRVRYILRYDLTLVNQEGKTYFSNDYETRDGDLDDLVEEVATDILQAVIDHSR
jgi:hypothetical protein